MFITTPKELAARSPIALDNIYRRIQRAEQRVADRVKLPRVGEFLICRQKNGRVTLIRIETEADMERQQREWTVSLCDKLLTVVCPSCQEIIRKVRENAVAR